MPSLSSRSKATPFSRSLGIIFLIIDELMASPARGIQQQFIHFFCLVLSCLVWFTLFYYICLYINFLFVFHARNMPKGAILHLHSDTSLHYEYISKLNNKNAHILLKNSIHEVHLTLLAKWNHHVSCLVSNWTYHSNCYMYTKDNSIPRVHSNTITTHTTTASKLLQYTVYHLFHNFSSFNVH